MRERIAVRVLEVGFFLVTAIVLFSAAYGANKPQPAAVPGKPPTYVRVAVKGIIGKDLTAKQLSAQLQGAASLKPTVVLLDIDTTGGAIDEAEQIVDLLITSRDLRFVALVRKALSAAVPIALACREVYVTDNAAIGGDALSVHGEPPRVDGQVPRDDEARRSPWRAVCRKAAQHGGHSSVLAEATADPSFALRLRKEADRIVLERNGAGKVVKEEGKVLMMTAQEAVSYGLAKAVVWDVDALGASLGLGGWKEVESAATTDVTLKGATIKDVYEALAGKLQSLSFTDPTLTETQKSQRLAQWRQWAGQQKIIGLKVSWVLALEEAGKNAAGRQADYYAEQVELYKSQLAGASARRLSARTVQLYRQRLAEAEKAIQGSSAHSYRVVAKSGGQMRVRSDRASADAELLRTYNDTVVFVRMEGQISDVTVSGEQHGGIGFDITLDTCKATYSGSTAKAKPFQQR